MDSVASFGRATGGKGVLYKYLNPHLEVVVTARTTERHHHYQKQQQRHDREETEDAKVQVVDTTTGAIVYAVQVSAIRGQVRAAMVENWLVFAWLERDGWRLGSVEVYEERKGEKGQR